MNNLISKKVKMNSDAKMETKEVLKTVRKIEIKTKHLVDGLLMGAFHSVFKGRGIEFSEVREYVPGDDIRAIDWNVTARYNQPFVKEFIEERDLTVYLLIDYSSSGEFGFQKSKRDSMIELAASLMFAAIRNNDKVGLCLFTEKVELFVPPRKGKKHTLSMISRLITFKPKQNKTSINETLKFISKVAKRKSIVFILSDFFTEENYSKALRILRNRHDVIAINMKDIRESEMPDVGYIELEDEETGEQILVNTSDEEFRKEYVRLVGEENSRLQNLFRKSRIDLIQLKSGEAFDVPLRKFFRLRERRMVR